MDINNYKRILYRLRMILIDLMIEPIEISKETEETITEKIKEKVNDIIKKQSN